MGWGHGDDIKGVMMTFTGSDVTVINGIVEMFNGIRQVTPKSLRQITGNLTSQACNIMPYL